MVKRLPYLFVGWLWFSITIAPVIGIIQISITAPCSMADRYHYLPSIGLAIMIAWGIPSLIKSEQIRKKILFPSGIAVLAILVVLTWQQCGYWKNSVILFNHALLVTQDNYLAHNNLGSFLDVEGKIDEAFNHYNKSIRLKPDYAIAYNNRGGVYVKLGQHQLAIKDFNETIRLRPDFAETYYNRGNAYVNLGQHQLAIKDYSEAIRLKPDFANTYYNRGVVYANLGQHQLAIKDYSEIIRLKPDFAQAYNNRANVYLNQGNNKLGCDDTQKACALGDCRTLEWAKGKGYCR
jgi:tetratricopeptide (TPR) repeat protein